MTLDQLRTIYPDATAETWHQHPNGGGWIKDTSQIDEKIHIPPTTIVYGDNVRIGDNADS